ncbi:PAS domain S-box-containing protein/diguanylate cyclase (GGDEF)-like protein [Geodermatophilus tzadiensis]|uniref:PAS domain S-box-containing protein/diguanylate cyclase (GGDEF)-like protein n=1 Tax=Geodermatophilus tzadiensis TaxID=1137988 RepID=A0A2T0SYQ4_9ACTN|nr:sensor domain-containing diguanylate cyclase [Geodermatophilus tzadiensis]PRY38534.1 PAS domain S-box-containing protein/diguanylate cyclase (GGDEF)-like protein [Geodermatophilus tzadiensis]
MFDVEAGGNPPRADLDSAFTHSPMGVALSTSDGELLAANAVLAELVGIPAEQLRGATLFAYTHPEDVPGARAVCRELRERRGRVRYECRVQRPDGRVVPVQATTSWVEGDPPHLVVVVEDVTERKELEARLLHLSAHDPLTGLPNRLLFHDRLRHALERGHREHTPTCVLVLDLDGFKAVNDEHGHHTGDAVLVAVAGRLAGVLRASDTAARLGGDEFAVVCENTERTDAEHLAARLREALPGTLTVGGTTVRVGLSIGIGSVDAGTEPEQAEDAVVRQADAAMYADKASRR